MRMIYRSNSGDAKDVLTYEPFNRDTLHNACIGLGLFYSRRYAGSVNTLIVQATLDIVHAMQVPKNKPYPTAHGELVFEER